MLVAEAAAASTLADTWEGHLEGGGMADFCLCDNERWSVVLAALLLPVEAKVLMEGGLLGW